MNSSSSPKPLWHLVLFSLILAAILLILFGIPLGGDRQNRIVIGNAALEQRLAAWQRTWQRMPTLEEAQRMMQQHTREEVLYREAVKRGLDQNNQAVRQALITQMQMLAESQVNEEELTDEAVEAYFALRRGQFRRPPEMTFVQIFLSTDRRGASAEEDARNLLARLEGKPLEKEVIRELGDPFLFAQDNQRLTPDEVANQFGEGFSKSILGLEQGRWQGPIPSAYGLHLVFVEQKVEGYIPELKEVAAEVIEDMRYDARQAAEEQFYTELIRQYDIQYRGDVKELMQGQ